MWGLDPVPNSAVNVFVPFSQSHILSVLAFSPKINIMIVIIIIDLILRCIFLYLINRISNIWDEFYN